MSTAPEEMRGLLTELKVPAKKADAIMERFEQLLRDQQTPATVWVAGSHAAVEVVEIYGLEIGVDACGNAEHVTPIGVGWPQGFELPELVYEAQS
jgi:hypothetical protein